MTSVDGQLNICTVMVESFQENIKQLIYYIMNTINTTMKRLLEKNN
ncbi:MAG: hypothetical protein Q7T50_08160 [Candidatus Magasanikbacteria bacterium]|nr:hypothetical protein [Candidatus Magasanikbacteria bacterium]